MSAGLNVTVANELLDQLGGTPWTPPAALFVQLHSGDPGAAGTANVITGPPRVQITSWNPSAGGVKTIASVPTWTNWSWTSPVTPSFISLWDAATTGNFQESAPLTGTLQQVVTGNNVTLTALTITLGPLAA